MSIEQKFCFEGKLCYMKKFFSKILFKKLQKGLQKNCFEDPFRH